MSNGRLTLDSVDVHVGGALTAQSFTPPASSVSNASVQAAADIDASKLKHRYAPVEAQANGTNNVAKTIVRHRVVGATGTVTAFRAGNRTAASGGDSTTVDLKKNGSSILTGVITLNAAAGTTTQNGTISSGSVVAGDLLEVVVALSGTNVGQGVWAQPVIDEAGN